MLHLLLIDLCAFLLRRPLRWARAREIRFFRRDDGGWSISLLPHDDRPERGPTR